jgi:hypothetical protein
MFPQFYVFPEFAFHFSSPGYEYYPILRFVVLTIRMEDNRPPSLLAVTNGSA